MVFPHQAELEALVQQLPSSSPKTIAAKIVDLVGWKVKDIPQNLDFVVRDAINKHVASAIASDSLDRQKCPKEVLDLLKLLAEMASHVSEASIKGEMEDPNANARSATRAWFILWVITTCHLQQNYSTSRIFPVETSAKLNWNNKN